MRKQNNIISIIVRITILIIITLSFSACSDVCDNKENNNFEWNKKIAVAYVHSYATAIGEAIPFIDTDSAKIEYIQNAVEPISFYPDSSGYFYVYNFDCINIAHAKQKNLVGNNLKDYKDSRGKFVIRELSAMAKTGSGYVEYHWKKPGKIGKKRKLGYVEPIPNTEYFIGTGVYLE